MTDLPCLFRGSMYPWRISPCTQVAHILYRTTMQCKTSAKEWKGVTGEQHILVVQFLWTKWCAWFKWIVHLKRVEWDLLSKRQKQQQQQEQQLSFLSEWSYTQSMLNVLWFTPLVSGISTKFIRLYLESTFRPRSFTRVREFVEYISLWSSAKRKIEFNWNFGNNLFLIVNIVWFMS